MIDSMISKVLQVLQLEVSKINLNNPSIAIESPSEIYVLLVRDNLPWPVNAAHHDQDR